MAFICQKPVDLSLLHVSSDGCARIKQVHGAVIHCVDFNNVSQKVEADGLTTNTTNLPLFVRTADCLSVFIYDPKQQAISLVHAGWRSTAAGIVTQALKVMQKKWGSHPEDLLVEFGPAIRDCCYQVSEEFKTYGFTSFIQKPDGLYFDLPQENVNQLLKGGVKEENINNKAPCTCCDATLHSYRRDGDQAGRMNAVMMLRGI